MANIQNLKPYKKGQSGNVNGRPRKLPQLDALLSDILGAETTDGKTEAHQVLEALLKAAKKGNVNAANAILSRAYGQPKAPIEFSNGASEEARAQVEALTPEQMDAIDKILGFGPETKPALTS